MKGIRYYSVIKGNGYWQPTARMRAKGFRPIACGKDGPKAWRIAEAENQKWDEALPDPLTLEKPGQPPRKADRMGHVYFIFVGDRVKIGYSAKPLKRFEELQTGFASPPRMFLIFRGRPRDEKALHQRFRVHHSHGEWFRAGPRIIREVMRFCAYETLSDALHVGENGEQTLNEFRVSGLVPASEEIDPAISD